jgi:MerR family copper efflux transcriptional regulator
LLKIGELAELAGVSKRTIDYYTTLGLLTADRSPSNYRYYEESALIRLRLIQEFKQKYLPLEEIKEQLALYDTYKESSLEDTIDRIKKLQLEMKKLEKEVLKLKPNLEDLSQEQQQLLTKHLNTQSISLAQTLMLMFN